MGMAAQRFNYAQQRWDSLNVTEDEKIGVMCEDIRKYIFKCQQWNNKPCIDEFLERHDEWNFDRYSDKIEAEFKRVQELT